MSEFQYVVSERTHDDQIWGTIGICRTRTDVFDLVEDHVKWIFAADIESEADPSELLMQKRDVVLAFEQALKTQKWTPSLNVALRHEKLDRMITVEAALVVGT